jgi:molecular chaperone GrpE
MSQDETAPSPEPDELAKEIEHEEGPEHASFLETTTAPWGSRPDADGPVIVWADPFEESTSAGGPELAAGPEAYADLHTDDPTVLEKLPTAPSTAEALDALRRELNGRLDSLASSFEREVRAESSREKVVDRLHAELQEYKNDFLLSTLRPVFIDLIQLHDDMGKVLQAPSSPEEARVLGLLEGYRQGIEDVLYRQGVEPFRVEGDDLFDPRRQRALSTTPTDDPALNKRLAARLRPGFRAGERVIRPELVAVYALRRN